MVHTRSEGLGTKFAEEVIEIFDALALNPLLHCRRHPKKNIRWRYPEHFPYRVIYKVSEQKKAVVVGAVLALHAEGVRCNIQGHRPWIIDPRKLK